MVKDIIDPTMSKLLMEKARLAAARFIVFCMAALILLPKSMDMTSQARSVPMDHHPGNPPDRPMPYRTIDDKIVEPDKEMISILSQPPYEPFIADNPPEFAPSAKDTGHAPKPSAKPKALVVIKINQADQRLSVYFDGEAVRGLDSVLVSTGQPGKATRTPDGTYSPREIAVRRPSHFASRLMDRPVYLTHAI